MNPFKSKSQLEDWLKQAAIDTSLWGIDNAKIIDNLWDELLAGETLLQDDPPLRLIDVVQITIRRGDQILMEVAQELGNGQIRSRNIVPSEKVKGHESYREAALRGLLEEVGVMETAVTFLPDTYYQIESETDSPSYPGLKTRYTFHQIEAEVVGLPDTDFWRDNAAFTAGDPVKRHHWGWRKSPA